MTLQVVQPTERNLHEIADSIWESIELGKQGAMQALDAQLAIGRDLLDARTRFPSDNDFGEWFGGQAFPFSQQWAWTLRTAAERESEVRQLVTTQVVTGGQPNIKKAVAEIRKPPSAPLIPYRPSVEVADEMDANELVAAVETLDNLRKSLQVSAAAAAQVRSRAAFARRLRLVGTYLGAIALQIEGETE